MRISYLRSVTRWALLALLAVGSAACTIDKTKAPALAGPSEFGLSLELSATPDAVKRELLQASDTHTTCSWKGVASYYHVAVGDEVNKDAAWYYPDTKPAAKNIEGYVAFWKGVKVEA